MDTSELKRTPDNKSFSHEEKTLTDNSQADMEPNITTNSEQELDEDSLFYQLPVEKNDLVSIISFILLLCKKKKKKKKKKKESFSTSIRYNSEAVSRFFSAIDTQYTDKNEKVATILLFVLKYKVGYISLINRIYPDTAYGVLARTFQKMADASIFKRLDSVDIETGICRKERLFFERYMKGNARNYKAREIGWFVFTELGKEYVSLIKEELEEISEHLEDIQNFKHKLELTHAQIKSETERSLDVQKAANLRITAISEELARLTKRRDMDIINDINRKTNETNGDRVAIAEQMLQDAKEKIKGVME